MICFIVIILTDIVFSKRALNEKLDKAKYKLYTNLFQMQELNLRKLY